MKNIHLFYFIAVLLYSLVIGCSTAHKPIYPTPVRANADVSELRRQITAYAQNYIGASYKYAGTSPATGFDCSGFTYYVLKAYQIHVSPASAEQAKEGREIELNRVKPGDLVFFGDETHIQHVALVVERKNDNSLICVHSTTSKGVIITNVSASSYWKPKILFARDVINR